MTGPDSNPLDDQLSRSFGDRADALGAVEPDVYDVRRRAGRQRNARRLIAGACAVVLVAGAGAAITWSANRSDGPAAADGETTTLPAPAPEPTSTVPGGPIACAADQYTTTGTETLIHLGQPFTATAGQCLVGTMRAMVPVGSGGMTCSLVVDPAIGAAIPSAPTTAVPVTTTACGTITECPDATTPPPPSTVTGGGSFPVVVQSFCSTSVTGGPIQVQLSPTSTVSSTCADGEVAVQSGDVVLAPSGMFELNVGQCIAASAQPLGTIVSCTVGVGEASGSIPAGSTRGGTIVDVITVPVLTTVPGQPVPEMTSYLTPFEGCAAGADGVVTVTGSAVPVVAPTTTPTVKN